MLNDPRPHGTEPATIVVLCCNELTYTKLCLESVLANTRRPFELVLVDNGSTDGTHEYLASLAARPGPDRVEILRNETNRGFAAGVNQGLERIRGDWVVLLNNDSVVPPHWLDRLLGPLVRGWPHVGFAGPVTNAAPLPQKINPGYSDAAGLDSFAERVWQEHGEAVLPFPRLSGFCLATHRSVLNRIGPLDEQFGVGFFEDDDLCVRARKAGYRLEVARGCYVHHFGSRTVRGLGLDAAAMMEANYRRFAAKWGEAEAAPYRAPNRKPDSRPVLQAPPAVHPRGTTPARRFRTSLTMIVRNEEHNLGACLDGLDTLFDEIVVVDTGSTDRTRSIAAEHGAIVSEFPWVDDFAAARNAALERATGDYVCWLDADDRLDAPNRERLARLLESLDGTNVASVFKCVCVPDRPGGTATVVDHVRLFPRRPGVRWEHRVHEQILPSLRRIGTEVRWTEIEVHHVGYVDPDVRVRKRERDLRILHRELEERPDHPFTLFNLGAAYQECGRDEEALQYLARSLQKSDPQDSITRKLFALIAQSQKRRGRPEDAQAAVDEGLTFFPRDLELRFLEGLYAKDAKDWDRAIRAFRLALNAPEESQFRSVDEGMRGVKAHHCLSSIFQELGRDKDARSEWRKAIDQDQLPALKGLQR